VHAAQQDHVAGESHRDSEGEEVAHQAAAADRLDEHQHDADEGCDHRQPGPTRHLLMQEYSAQKRRREGRDAGQHEHVGHSGAAQRQDEADIHQRP
jgi:hypothetical protein